MSAPANSDAPALSFVIPVRHHDNAPDWDLLLRRLMQTAASIAAQTSASWRAFVVANTESRIPRLPQGFELVPVDLPANKHFDRASCSNEVFYDSVQLDKGQRVLAGMLAAGRTGYLMVVDDDDFIHRGLVRFVVENAGENGWAIHSGYVWTEGGRLLFLHRKFSNICGTCHIIRADLYGLPERAEDADDEWIRTMLGGHRKIEKVLADRATPLAPLPFPGAIKRVGYSGQHSGSASILRRYIRPEIARPRVLVRTLGSLRWITPGISRSFGI